MFRFTIRDLFFVTLLVGMGGAWWVNCRNLHVRNESLNADRTGAIRQSLKIRDTLKVAKENIEFEEELWAWREHPFDRNGVTRMRKMPGRIDWSVLDEEIPAP